MAEVNNGRNVETLLKRVFMFLEDGDWQKADEYCERVLDIDSECGKAYFGKFMAYYKIENVEKINNGYWKAPFQEMKYFDKAYKYADDELKEQLEFFILDRENYQNSQEQKYQQALKLMNENTKESLEQAQQKFIDLGYWEDSSKLADDCFFKVLTGDYTGGKNDPTKTITTTTTTASATTVKNEEKEEIEEVKADEVQFGKYPQGKNGEIKPIIWKILDITKQYVFVISKYALDCMAFHNESRLESWEDSDMRAWLNGKFYNEAFSNNEKEKIIKTKVSDGASGRGTYTLDHVSLLNYTDAKEYFRSDEERKCKPTLYAQSHGGYTGGIDHDSAWYWLRNFGTYSYNPCCDIVNPGGQINCSGPEVTVTSPYCVRPIMWISIDAFSKEKIEKAKKARNKTNVYLNDHIADIKAGKINEVEFGQYQGKPINWEIIDKKGDKVLFFSKKVLCEEKMNSSHEEVSWRDCTLRSWLNVRFIEEAFTQQEAKRISSTLLLPDKNPNYRGSKGTLSKDKIFLLSIQEVKKYFEAGVQREEDKPFGLRTKGYYGSAFCFASYDGTINYDGKADDTYFGVRPAMWITL